MLTLNSELSFVHLRGLIEISYLLKLDLRTLDLVVKLIKWKLLRRTKVREIILDILGKHLFGL